MKIEASIKLTVQNGKLFTVYKVLLIDGPLELSIVEELENDIRHHVDQMRGMIVRAREIANHHNRVI